MGLHRAGFYVTGIDITLQKHYPFKFVQADVLQLTPSFLKKFDLIWASPPCQAYSVSSVKWKHLGKTYPDLIEATRALILASKRPYIIENVPPAPIRHDLLLCGEMFRMRIIRHRYFEIEQLFVLQPPHRPHISRIGEPYYSCVAGGHGGRSNGNHPDCSNKAAWEIAMGIDWMTKPEIAQSVPPVYSEYIGRQAIKNFKKRNRTKTEIIKAHFTKN